MHRAPANAGADPSLDTGCAGVYADLDFHSLKDSTGLLQGHEVLLGALVPREHAQMLPNAWLASAHARHPFWLFCVKEIIERVTACALASLPEP